MIPTNIDMILNRKYVENERVEFKKSWNPQPIMHTICAYANDILNLSGGYIIIGINDDGTVEGINPKSMDKMNRDLNDICNKIEPCCNVYTDLAEKDDKSIFIIWVPAGRERPYRCPIGTKGEKAYFIRKLSCTMKANGEETRELIDMSNDLPFDDGINPNAKIGDVDINLVVNFLSRTGSTLFDNIPEMGPIEILERMNLVGGPSENRRPLNVTLLMFSYHPEDFIRYAYIDFVDKPDPTGEGMMEKRFTGPLDRQIDDCMMFIKNYVICTSISKPNDRPESDVFYNYPLKAIEEAVSNAVFHKDYRRHEPVTITMLPDRLEITSIPGPFRSITDDDLENCHLVSRTTRNRRIGEYLKELKLVESRNTGIPTMIAELEKNGSELPLFRTDGDRTYMTVIIRINPFFLRDRVKSFRETKIERRTKEQIRLEIVDALDGKEMSVRQLSILLGYKTISPSFRSIVNELIADGTIENAYSNRFTSKQKIRLRR